MAYREEYERWLHAEALSDDERAELSAIGGDEKEIEDRFFAPLSFGTAGLRGVLGVGLHRMNIHTVRQATQGMATLICGMGKEARARGVAICMDCRIGSEQFAREAALRASTSPRATTPRNTTAIRRIGRMARSFRPRRRRSLRRRSRRPIFFAGSRAWILTAR